MLAQYLSWTFTVATVAGWIYLFHAQRAVRRFMLDRGTPAAADEPVTLLKPLCGGDPELYENLASFFRQKFGEFQIVFGVRDAADPAVPVVRRLLAEFPAVDVTLVIDGSPKGVNPKIANLRNMLPVAEHDLLIVSDSDMRVRPDYIVAIAAALRRTGLTVVTCLYRGISAGGFWSDLACMHINHCFLPQAVVARNLNLGCFGATFALRRQTLEAIGGFDVVADALADDYQLGAAVRRCGGQVVLSEHVVDNVVKERSPVGLFRHELRWARTIRSIAPIGYGSSIVTNPMAFAILALLFDADRALPAGIVIATLIVRIATATANDRALGLRPSTLWLLPIRDVMSFAVFVLSYFSHTVNWRGQIFSVQSDGSLVAERR